MRKDQLAEIFDQYSGELYLYAYSLCRDHFTAQEIVSETFFKAFLALDQCTDRVKYWLLTVCRRLVIDEFRRKGRLTELPAEKALGEKDAGREDPLVCIIEDERRRELYRALQSLGEQYKEAVTLFYFAGLSTEEIAAAMKISPGAVRNLLYRGRNALRALMEEGGDEYE